MGCGAAFVDGFSFCPMCGAQRPSLQYVPRASRQESGKVLSIGDGISIISKSGAARQCTVDKKLNEVKIHYEGFKSHYDEWLQSPLSVSSMIQGSRQKSLAFLLAAFPEVRSPPRQQSMVPIFSR